MNPTYTLFIDICLTKLEDKDNIWMRAIIRLPYVPRNCDKLKLTSDNGDDTLELELESVIYDTAEGCFVSDIEDDRMVQHFREDGTLCEQDAVATYKAFGFTRLNFPQGEGRT